MTPRILLDTNAYSALQRGDAATLDIARSAEQILMSSIVLGELLFGFRRGTRFARNVAELDAFLAAPFVEKVLVSRSTADRYALVFADLLRKGRPIPTNDVWVAAHALETGAELVSFDAHFAEVGGLLWTPPRGGHAPRG